VTGEQTQSSQERVTDTEERDARLPWHPPTAELHGIEIVKNGGHFNIVGDGVTTCSS
jgi:hypothetical protein